MADVNDYDFNWKWRNALPYLSAHDKLDKMDEARLSTDAGSPLRLLYCQFLCSLIDLGKSSSNPPMKAHEKVVFKCGDVITNCVSAELVFKLGGLLEAKKKEVIESDVTTRVRATEDATKFNEVVGCYRFAKENKVTAMLPQLTNAYEHLDRLYSQVRAVHLFMLAATGLESADTDMSDSKMVVEAVGYATSFEAAWKDLPPIDREGLVDASDVRELFIAARRTYGGHLASKGRFRAAKNVYESAAELAPEQLAMSRLLTLDLEPCLKEPTPLPVISGGPLRVGSLFTRPRLCRDIFKLTPSLPSVKT